MSLYHSKDQVSSVCVSLLHWVGGDLTFLHEYNVMVMVMYWICSSYDLLEEGLATENLLYLMPIHVMKLLD